MNDEPTAPVPESDEVHTHALHDLLDSISSDIHLLIALSVSHKTFSEYVAAAAIRKLGKKVKLPKKHRVSKALEQLLFEEAEDAKAHVFDILRSKGAIAANVEFINLDNN